MLFSFLSAFQSLLITTNLNRKSYKVTFIQIFVYIYIFYNVVTGKRKCTIFQMMFIQEIIYPLKVNYYN